MLKALMILAAGSLGLLAFGVVASDDDVKPDSVSLNKAAGMISFGEHRELGQVHWHRDLDQAVARAKKVQRPIAVLFQEVPG